MRVEQRIWRESEGWNQVGPPLGQNAHFVLIFGERELLAQDFLLAAVRERYPGARLMGCSTAGEICDTRVFDRSIVTTAVAFDSTYVHCAQIDLADEGDSRTAGTKLAAALPSEQLVHVFVLSDGLAVNGSDLVRGLASGLPSGVGLTGGLSGDGARFQQTLVCLDGAPTPRRVAALGLYGSRLRVGCGSLGGWDSFGPERLVTRSDGNVLFELDGQSALGLYKKYLGEHAAGLPATALHFPLAVRVGEAEPVVRTILGVDEQAQCMTFAGDVPQGAFARLMKANFERLIDGASGAARACQTSLRDARADLAILISCVGRKLVLKQRVEEEVESVREVLGAATALTGFYSYGEISPFTPSARCELHNQTMTITTLSEH